MRDKDTLIIMLDNLKQRLEDANEQDSGTYSFYTDLQMQLRSDAMLKEIKQNQIESAEDLVMQSLKEKGFDEFGSEDNYMAYCVHCKKIVKCSESDETADAECLECGMSVCDHLLSKFDFDAVAKQSALNNK